MTAAADISTAANRSAPSPAARLTSINGRVAGLGAMGVLCALIITIGAHWTVSSVIGHMSASRDAAALLTHVESIELLYDAIRSDVSEAANSGADAAEYREHKQQFQETLDEILESSVAHQPGITRHLEALVPLLKGYLKSAESHLSSPRPSDATSAHSFADFQRQYEPLEEKLEALSGLAVTAAADASRSTGESVSQSLNLLTGIAALALVILCALSFRIGRSIANPLTRIAAIIGRIAQGDLHVQVPALDRTDEIGTLARALLGMRDTQVSNLRLAFALQNAATNVVVADQSNRIIYVNKSGTTLFRKLEADLRQALPQFSADSIVGLNINEFYSSLAQQRGTASELVFGRIERVKIGGITLDVSANPITSDAGDQVGIVAEWTDLTAELAAQGETEAQRAAKDAEIAAERAAGERRQARILEALKILGDGIIAYDKNDRLVLCTDLAQEFFKDQAHLFVLGRTYTEVLQHGLNDGLFPDAKGRQAEWLDARMRARQKCNGQFEYQLPDKRWLLVQERRTTEGGVVTLCRNVTERKEAELALEHTQKDIAQLAEAAAAGNFSTRVDLTSKSGMMADLGGGMNKLLDTVSTALADIGQVIAAIAQGDLSKRIVNAYSGDLGKLKDDVNGTADKLSSVIHQTAEGIAAIKSATSQLAAGSQELSARTEDEVTNLENISGGIRQLARAAGESAGNADQAKQLALAARNAAESGGGVADEAITAMGKISKSSRRISDIIGMIDDIAFQTSLLALNAAVEAARAGEAGRGFAVVAKEVRNLAQRSSGASKEIKALISESSGHVQDGVDLVNRAGESLTEIVTSIKSVADIVSEIAEASRDQSTAVTAMQGTMDQIENNTQHNAALVEESSAALSSVDKQAEGILEVVDFFATNRNANHASPAGVRTLHARLAHQVGAAPIASHGGAGRTQRSARPRPANPPARAANSSTADSP